MTSIKKLYLVTYDLNSPGQNYSKVIDAIKIAGDGGYVSVCKSSFLICSSLQTAQEVFRKLTYGLDINDDIFITEIKQNFYYYLPEKEQLCNTIDSLLRSAYL